VTLPNYDVVIIGAGPAGSTAAKVCTEKGFLVLVLDRKTEIGSPNHCGEGVSKLCLDRVGAKGDESWIRSRVKGARIRFPNRTTLHFTADGFCIDRPEFDRFLADKARTAGTEFRLETDVKTFVQLEDGWLIRTADGFQCRASYLIGAGGARCPFAHFLGQRPYLLPAFQYKFPLKTNHQVDPEWLDFFHRGAFPGGYAWMFPRGNEVSIGVGSNRNPKKALQDLCAELGYSHEQATLVEGGPIPFPKKPVQIVFPRALLAGDSGSFIYPLTKGGIHGAIWSGELAGQSISSCLESGRPADLHRFRLKVQHHPSRRPRHLWMPQTFFNFNDRMFNGIGNIMNTKEFSDMAVSNLLKELVGNPSMDLVKAIFFGGIIQYQFRKTRTFSW